jgi:flagellar motor switch protein FliM
MSDVLSQSEVDALLQAVSTSPGVKKAGPKPPSGPVEYYDFLRPERISSAELRSLNELHELCARAISAVLSDATRIPVQCRLQTFDQVAWGEFVMGLPNPTCFGVVNVRTEADDAGANAASGTIACEIAYGCVYPMIDRMLGSQKEPGEPPGRAMTDIETRVAGAVISMLLQALREVWRRARDLAFELQHIESNPQVVPMASATEMAALATFEVIVGEGNTGLAHACIPLAQLGAFMRQLAAVGVTGTPATASSTAAARRALGRVPVGVDVYGGFVQMRLRDIVRLAAGSTIRTGRKLDDDAEVWVADKPKFRARVGDSAGRRAVGITRPFGGGYGGD